MTFSFEKFIKRIIGRKQPEIVKHDGNHDYISLRIAAEKAYPEKPLEQLEYIKHHGNNQFYTIAMLEKAQHFMSTDLNCYQIDLKFDKYLLDYLFRGMLDMARHLQSDLPDGVHDYIANRIDTFVLKAISDALREKAIIDYKEQNPYIPPHILSIMGK